MLMVSSCISDISDKTKKVSKLETTINNSLIKKYKTGKRIDIINKFGFPASKDEISQKYLDIEDKVRDAWLKTRQENIPKDSKWNVSMSELIMQFLNTLNRNPYQYSLVSEKIVIGAINSFVSHCSGRATTMEDVKNARDLVDAFRTNIGIKKDMRLSRLRYTLEQNKIIEGR